MCGIVGEYSFEPGAGTDVIPALTEMIARRGPDDAGYWSDGVHCTFGFRRLAILDLSPLGHQPMLTPDGRFALVYNGEMYNYRALRHELEIRGVHFRSSGDSEVVLHALAEWGTAALERFNGMFALALYDATERRLLLARDHAGIKPLYYGMTAHGLVFASQYDQLLAHPWHADLRASPDGLALYLRLGYIPAPYGLLDATFMLEPGSWLEVNRMGAPRKGRYYTFPKYRTPDLRGEAAFEAADAAITDAVRRQMISDVPLGSFLSGGIDSPLVAAKMRMINQTPALAFTIGVDDDAQDESADATAYAREIGLRHMLETITPAQALDMLDDVIAACGEPLADYSMFPTMLISRLARRDVTVMLSGDGGDELFWGYAERFSAALRLAPDYRQPYWLRKARWGARKHLAVGSGYRALCYPTLGDYTLAKQAYLTEGWYRWLFDNGLHMPAQFDLFEYSGWRPDETAQWLRWNEFTGHLTRVLLKVDRASMYHSLEVRVPLLDREVIEVAARIDWRSCLDPKRNLGKLPLRWALRRHVQHQTREKRGFGVPMGNWLRGPLRPLLDDMVLSRREIMGLPMNREVLARLTESHMNAIADYTLPLWTLLSLAFWETQHYHKRLSYVHGTHGRSRV